MSFRLHGIEKGVGGGTAFWTPKKSDKKTNGRAAGLQQAKATPIIETKKLVSGSFGGGKGNPHETLPLEGIEPRVLSPPAPKGLA